MNNNTHSYIAVGQEVVFVDGNNKSNNGIITEVFNQNTARVEWENGIGIGDYSDKGDPGTFHFEQASPKAENQK